MEALKVEHAQQATVVERMMSKVNLAASGKALNDPTTDDLPSKQLLDAQRKIQALQAELLQKEEDIAALTTEEPGGTESAVHEMAELRQRLERAEKTVTLQREMIQSKEEQVKSAVQSTPGVVSVSSAEADSLHALRQELEALQAEKETVQARARQAVDELTAQLAKTRAAREKELERKMKKQEEQLNNFKQQARIDLEVKNFLAERVRQLEEPEGFATELATLQGKVTHLSGENANLEETTQKATQEASRLRQQVYTIQKEKDETLTQIQAWGVNAFVSQQLQDLRDALQACHAERDDAVEQIKTTKNINRQMAARLIDLGAEGVEGTAGGAVTVPAQSVL